LNVVKKSGGLFLNQQMNRSNHRINILRSTHL